MNIPGEEGPVVGVRLGADGLPSGAAASARIERPVAQVWAVIQDIERWC